MTSLYILAVTLVTMTMPSQGQLLGMMRPEYDSEFENDNIPFCSDVQTRSISEERLMITCPPRAVCGDEWRTVKDWNNGTRCRQLSQTFHCQCPGSTACPVGNMNHVFFENTKQRRFLCEPRCSVERCSTRFRPSVIMVQQAPEFFGHNYYKINCRCADHDIPIPAMRGQLNRATKYQALQRNYTTGIVQSIYKCANVEGIDTCEFPVGL